MFAAVHPPLQARIENYGLYRCYEREAEQVVDFVHFLIPITPLLRDFTNNVRLDCTDDRLYTIHHFDGSFLLRWHPVFMQHEKEGICAGRCNSTVGAMKTGSIP